MAGGHFKLYCSMGNHRKTLGAYRDDRTLAAYARLGMLAIERYADRTEDEFLVSSLDLIRAFNVRTVQSALKRATVMAQLAPIRVALAPDVAPDAYRVSWPNFAKKQFPRRSDAPRNRVSPNIITGPSASASATATKKNPPNPPSGGTRASRKAKRTAAPEDLSAEEKRRLKSWVEQSESWAVPHLRELVDACLGHFQASGGLKASWYRACQNWIRKERQDGMRFYQNVSKGQGNGVATDRKREAAAVDRHRAQVQELKRARAE